MRYPQTTSYVSLLLHRKFRYCETRSSASVILTRSLFTPRAKLIETPELPSPASHGSRHIPTPSKVNSSQAKTQGLPVNQACNLTFYSPSNRRFWNPHKVNIVFEEPELPVWGIILFPRSDWGTILSLFSDPVVTEPTSHTPPAPCHTPTQTKMGPLSARPQK